MCGLPIFLWILRWETIVLCILKPSLTYWYVFCFVLFCFVLFCFVLFCFVLFCFVLFCCNLRSLLLTFVKNPLLFRVILPEFTQIGRASCRERVCQYV